MENDESRTCQKRRSLHLNIGERQQYVQLGHHSWRIKDLREYSSFDLGVISQWGPWSWKKPLEFHKTQYHVIHGKIERYQRETWIADFSTLEDAHVALEFLLEYLDSSYR